MDDENLICPYCGNPKYTQKSDSISAFICLTNCAYCGNRFGYSIILRREYGDEKDGELEE